MKKIIFCFATLLFGISSVNAASLTSTEKNAIDKLFETKLDELFPDDELFEFSQIDTESASGSMSTDLTEKFDIYLSNGYFIPDFFNFNETTYITNYETGTGNNIIGYLYGTCSVTNETDNTGECTFNISYIDYVLLSDDEVAERYTTINGKNYVENRYNVQKDVPFKLNEVEADEDLVSSINDYLDTAEKKFTYSDLTFVNSILSTFNNKGVNYGIKNLESFIGGVNKYFGQNNIDFYFMADRGTGSAVEIDGYGTTTIYSDGVLYHFSIPRDGKDFGLLRSNIIYVPEGTEEENYISVAKDRIDKYINNDNYEVTITETEYEICELLHERAYCDALVMDSEYDSINNVIQLEHPENFETANGKIYKLKIKYLATNEEKEYSIAIGTGNAEKMKEPEVNYLDYKTNILIKSNASELPFDSFIEAKEITSEDELFDIIEEKLGKEVFNAYDISLFSNYKGAIKTIENGVIYVYIPLLEGINEENAKIYYISDDGETIEEFESEVVTINETKYVKFETSHFSTYILSNGTTTPNPKTGDGIMNTIIIAIISLIGMLGTNLYIKKRYN